MEAAAIIIAGTIMSGAIVLFLALVFMVTSWALRQFGFSVSWEQFMAALALIVVVRVVLSYIFHQNK